MNGKPVDESAKARHREEIERFEAAVTGDEVMFVSLLIGASEDDARQVETVPAHLRRCLVCRIDIAHLRAGARTCGDACRNVLSRLLRGRRCSVP